MSKCTALAKARIDSLHYKNERSMSFEKYTEFLTKAFTTLEKDEDERLSNRQKVDDLLRESTPETPAGKQGSDHAELPERLCWSMCLFLSASLPVARRCSVGGP